jgi:hypothetical protein
MRQFGGIRRRRITAVPGIAVATASFVLVLAACGSSTRPTAQASTSTPSPTAAAPTATPTSSIDDFVAQANAICTGAQTSDSAIPTPSTSNGDVGNPAASDLPVIATYFSSIVTILNTVTSQLQALGTPPSNQSEWSAAMSAWQTDVTDFQNALAAAQAGELSTYDAAITQEQTDNQAVATDFGTFGATVCAGGSTSSPSPSASASVSPSATPTPS